MADHVYLAEITAAIDGAGTTTVLRYGTEGHITAPGETPPNAFYDPRLRQPGSLARNLFSDRTTSGASRIGYGEITLINNDGALDALAGYGFDGQPLVVLTGPRGAPYPSGWTVAFTGTMESAEFTATEVIIRLRDRLAELDKPVLQTLYAGNNSLPNGLEGTADNIKGQPKPRAYGSVFNVSPPLVNTSRLIYETGSCKSVDAVYDRGAALTKGADYSSQSDMESNAPAAGNFRVWPAGGYFRLGSSPAGQITADVTQGAAAGNRTAAQLLKQIALDAGIAAGDIVAADVAALDALNSAAVGVWVSDTSTAVQIMDAVAASVGAWYGFDRSGRLRMGRLDAPAGTPAGALDQHDTIGLERVTASDGTALPIWRAIVNHARNWTPQSSDLAGSVGDARKAWLTEGTRVSKAENSSVKAKHKLAGELTRDTLLVASADADTEAARLLALYAVDREVYRCKVEASPALCSAIDLGAVVSLTHNRFGLTGGKLFRVIGVTTDYRTNRLELTLWG